LWRTRRYVCIVCHWTFTETHPGVLDASPISARFRAGSSSFRAGHAHAEVAGEEHISCSQLSRAGDIGAERLHDRRDCPADRCLSLDEGRARTAESASVISDCDHRRVIDALDGGTRQIVSTLCRHFPSPSDAPSRSSRSILTRPTDKRARRSY